MEIAHQAKLERFLERKDTLEQSRTKSRALICNARCNETRAQDRIEECPDCETTSIRDNPMDLLKKIQVMR